MKILVVGCGSIGTRRAKILAAKGHQVGVADPAGAGPFVNDASVPYFADLGHARGDWEAAVICTLPGSGRTEQVQACLDLGVRGLFVEKPLALDASDLDEIKQMFGVASVSMDEMGRTSSAFRNENVVTMGACNLRFCGGVNQLRKLKQPWRNARFRMGQHSKFWSPTHQPISMILDSIHELDLAAHLQGPIESIRGYSEQDNAEVSVHHKGGGLSHIILDRKTDPPVRDVAVWRAGGEYDSLRLDTGPRMYERELEHFINCVGSGVPTVNPLLAAAELCARALEVAV